MMRWMTGVMLAAVLGVIPSVSLAGGDNTLSAKEKQAGWTLLFNGKDLTGWEARGGKWFVKDGVLLGGGQGGLVYTGGKYDQYTDFELSADIKVWDTGKNPKARHLHRGNSGIFFRSEPAKGWPKGGSYEAQVDHGDKENPTGSIYGYRPIGRDPKLKDGEWFNMRIKAVGNHIVIWVNDEITLDTVDTKNRSAKGYFLLQSHHPTDRVAFKNIKLLDLADVKTASTGAAGPALQFTMKDIDGNPVNLADYQGKVLMFVNVASKCGLTPQYTDIEKLYEKYADRGFAVLGFPANNFLGQEPGTDAEIKQFCSTKFSVTFPLFSKVSVKGKDQCELYRYLTDKERNPHTAGKIRWNFEKFIIDRSGNVVADFHPKTKPFDKKLVAVIEKELAKK